MCRTMVVLPRGSLGRVLQFLRQIGYPLHDPDERGCCGDYEGVRFCMRNRRLIPRLVAEGNFDGGITGRDLVIASGFVQKLRVLGEVRYSRASTRPSKWVLACKDGFPKPKNNEQPIRIGCEIPGVVDVKKLDGLPRGTPVEFVPIEGDEEQAIDDGLCDVVALVTETGNSLSREGLSIVGEVMESYPVLIAKKHLKFRQREDMETVLLALQAAVGAESKKIVTFDIRTMALQKLTLPSAVSPTVSRLVKRGWAACQICIDANEVPGMLTMLKRGGAEAVLVQDVRGFLL